MSIYYTILLHPSRGRAPNYSGLFLFPKLIRSKNESKQPRLLLLGKSVPGGLVWFHNVPIISTWAALTRRQLVLLFATASFWALLEASISCTILDFQDEKKGQKETFAILYAPTIVIWAFF